MEDKLTRTLTKQLKGDKHLLNSFMERQKQYDHLPVKLQNIEKKLTPYRSIKLQTEIKAQKERSEQCQYREEFRQDRINQLRNHNVQIKKQAQNIKVNWQKTQDDRNRRINKEQTLEDNLTNAYKRTLMNERDLAQKEIHENLEQFQENCARQGIQLIKNSDEPITSDPNVNFFNENAIMMKIKEKSKQNDLAQKQKRKRKNRLIIEEQQKRILIEEQKEKQDFIESTFQVCQEYQKIHEEGFLVKERKRVEFETRKAKAEEIFQMRQTYMEEQSAIWDQYEKDNYEKKQIENRERKINDIKSDFERKILKREKNVNFLQPTTEFLLEMTEICNQNFYDNQIDFNLWNQICEKFVNNQPLVKVEENAIFTEKSVSKVDILAFNYKMFNSYYNCTDSWEPQHYFLDENKSNEIQPNYMFGDLFINIIDRMYPAQIEDKKQFQQYQPLKISIIGKDFCGKKTIAKLFVEKYGLQIIDPFEICKQAYNIAYPPAIDEKDKKKKPTKKKDEVEDPLLLELGQKILQAEIYSDSILTDDNLVSAIQYKVNELFTEKTEEEFKNIFEDAKKQQQQLQQKTQEAQKKQKKPEELDEMQLLMKNKSAPYTSGFILLNFPVTVQQAQKLEYELTGHIDTEERLNKTAEQKKKELKTLFPTSQEEIIQEGIVSGIDCLFHLEVNEEIRENRGKNMRWDPVGEIMYQLDNLPTNIKGLADRLVILPNCEEEMITQNGMDFDQEAKKLKKWYQKFSNKELEQQTYQIIDGQEGNLAEIFGKFENINVELLKYSNEKYEKLFDENQQQEEIQEEEIDYKQLNFERIKDIVINIDNQSFNIIYNIFEGFQIEYQSQIYSQLCQLKEHRENILEGINEVQSKYLKFLYSNDNSSILHEFQQKLEKFLKEQSEEVTKTYQAKEEITFNLQQTNKKLWGNLQEKQNQLIDQRQQIIQSGWVEKQIQQLFDKFLEIISTEINHISFIVKIIYFFLYQNKEKRIDLDKYINKLKLNYQILEKIDIEDELDFNSFGKVDEVFEQYNNISQQLIDNIQDITVITDYKEKQGNIQQSLYILFNKVFQLESTNFKNRGFVIKQSLISRIKELRVMSQCLYNRLDDWIIEGIRDQNSYIYELTKQIKQEIKKSQISELKQNEHQKFEIVSLLSQEPVIIMSAEEVYDKKFTIAQLKLFTDELIYISVNGLISTQVFNNFLKNRINQHSCSRYLPLDMKKLSQTQITSVIKNIQQNTTEEYRQQQIESYQQEYPTNQIQLSRILLFFMLLGSPLPDNDSLQQYYQALQEDQMDQYNFVMTPAWFDNSESDLQQREQIQYDRTRLLKNFIFEVYEEHNLVDYETLIQDLCSIDQQNLNLHGGFWEFLFGE